MWHERAFNFFIWSPNLIPGLCPGRPYQVHPHWHWGAVLKSQDLGEVYHHNMAILKNLNECCLSLWMHRSCSENRHGRLASWENHYTLHPLANKERNISQHFPVVRKLPWQKQTPKGVETTPWARRCRLQWWSSQSETWVFTNWCMITWLFHLPVSGMQRSYFEGVAAQDTPGFFVGNDCMGRGRGRCSFDMSWPSSGFATSPLVHPEWQVSFQLMQWRVLCWATQLKKLFKLNIFVTDLWNQLVSNLLRLAQPLAPTDGAKHLLGPPAASPTSIRGSLKLPAKEKPMF